MAKLPALISAYAQFDGRDRASIEHVARVVREAGYIPTTKRGPGASDMTSREAVNLFLGMNGADVPKEASAAIERFRSLKTRYSGPKDLSLNVFKAISNANNFGEALQALIDGTPDVLLAAAAFYDHGYPEPKGREQLFRDFLDLKNSTATFKVEVELHRYYATIECLGWIGDDETRGRWQSNFRAEFLIDANLLHSGFYGPRQGDRQVSVRFTHRTFFALWRCLNAKADQTEYSPLIEFPTSL